MMVRLSQVLVSRCGSVAVAAGAGQVLVIWGLITVMYRRGANGGSVVGGGRRFYNKS